MLNKSQLVKIVTGWLSVLIHEDSVPSESPTIPQIYSQNNINLYTEWAMVKPIDQEINVIIARGKLNVARSHHKTYFLSYRVFRAVHRCHSRPSPSAFCYRVSGWPEKTTINLSSIFLGINETSTFFDGISQPFNILNSPEDTLDIEFLFLARWFAYIASLPFMPSTLYANTPRNKQIVFCVKAPQQSPGLNDEPWWGPSWQTEDEGEQSPERFKVQKKLQGLKSHESLGSWLRCTPCSPIFMTYFSSSKAKDSYCPLWNGGIILLRCSVVSWILWI